MPVHSLVPISIGGATVYMLLILDMNHSVKEMFPAVCREILRLRQQSRKRQEEAEIAALLRLETQAGAGGGSRKRGFWRTLINPFAGRRDSVRA